MSVETSSFVPDAARETKEQVFVEVLQADDREGIFEYIKHEVSLDFEHLGSRVWEARQRGSIGPEVSDEEARGVVFNELVLYRQDQIRQGKLRVILGREGDEKGAPVVATSVVALESGTMGKTFKPNEAWAAGTAVRADQQSQGIGERMGKAQEVVARDAQKEFMLTEISAENGPSERLRINKLGYALEGVTSKSVDREGKIPTYRFRKDLRSEMPQVDWVGRVKDGSIRPFGWSGESNMQSDEVFVDPLDKASVQSALNQGSRGVALLRPEDFGNEHPIEHNIIVFVRKVPAIEASMT